MSDCYSDLMISLNYAMNYACSDKLIEYVLINIKKRTSNIISFLKIAVDKHPHKSINVIINILDILSISEVYQITLYIHDKEYFIYEVIKKSLEIGLKIFNEYCYMLYNTESMTMLLINGINKLGNKKNVDSICINTSFNNIYNITLMRFKTVMLDLCIKMKEKNNYQNFINLYRYQEITYDAVLSLLSYCSTGNINNTSIMYIVRNIQFNNNFHIPIPSEGVDWGVFILFTYIIRKLDKKRYSEFIIHIYEPFTYEPSKYKYDCNCPVYAEIDNKIQNIIKKYLITN